MNKKFKSTALRFLSVSAMIAVCFCVRTSVFAETQSIQESGSPTTPIDISDLESQIKDRQSKISALEQQQQIYEATIAQKQQESLSLKNQVTVLDSEIGSADLSVQKLNLQIESLSLEIKELNGEIQQKEGEILQQKERLSEFLRTMYRNERRTTLEVSLSNNTFSQFFNQLKYLETVQAEAKRLLDRIQILKADLETQRNEEQAKKSESEEKKKSLVQEMNDLESQKRYRTQLLNDTKNSEQRFQDLLNQSKQEQLSANSDIQQLEVEIRKRLEGTNELPKGPTDLLWPIVSHRITAYFHDPSYIFKNYFEHSAIDIATPQGTAVRATASGFVARAKNAGLGYSYIMIIHSNKLSTVYGHISQISVVEDDFVVQGQVIGYSGGIPGTPGAGRLTTGPHLHFEVRLEGIPQNPLNYLP